MFQNARVQHLIKVLLRAELYHAANYLSDDLLHLGPVPQPQPAENPASDSSEEQKQRKVHTDGDQPVKEKLSQSPASSSLSEDDMKTISAHMSYDSSPLESGLNEANVMLSQLQRQSSVSYEDQEEAWIGTTFFVMF